MLKDERVQYWIENYRNLLDAWRFWHKRAEFDIHRSKLDPSSKPLAQVNVNSCLNYDQSRKESGKVLLQEKNIADCILAFMRICVPKKISAKHALKL